MILHLIRHGETASNRAGLGQGRADHPLTELGLRQATAVAARFQRDPLDLVVSSPLIRARTVAEAIAAASACRIELRDELVEMDVGETDGMPPAEMRERFPEFFAAWASDDCESVQMPGGESLLDVRNRISPLIESLAAREDQRVAVVSHNFVTKVALAHLAGLTPNAFRRFSVDLASVSTVSLRDGRTTILGLNDTCHIMA